MTKTSLYLHGKIMNNRYYITNIYENSNQKKNECFILFLKSISKKIIVPLIKIYKSNNKFKFRNIEYDYFIHGYNTTWTNERTVEIPIIHGMTENYVKSYFTSTNTRILEVGNVLSHYTSVDWDILDKFEKAKGIINKDIVSFKPKDKYDLIISISTLEHVGFDDDEKDVNKIIEAIINLKNNCLKVGGKMIVTLPIGYNKEMDKKLFTGKLGFDDIFFLKRISKRNEWKEVEKNEVIYVRYGHPFSSANAICIGIMNK